MLLPNFYGSAIQKVFDCRWGSELVHESGAVAAQAASSKPLPRLLSLPPFLRVCTRAVCVCGAQPQLDHLLSGSKASDVSTTRFMVWGAVLGFAVDMSVYPASVIGTRLQISRTVRTYPRPDAN